MRPMSSYVDPLADLAEDDFAEIRNPPSKTETSCELEEHASWSELYRLGIYNWEGFDASYEVIPLTQGYFSIVDKKDAKKVQRNSWCADIVRNSDGSIRTLYAVRAATKKERAHGAPKKIYLHRFVAGAVLAGKSSRIDHVNGHGLCNLSGNLHHTNESGNSANRFVSSRTGRWSNLPQGVSPIRTRNKASNGAEVVTGYRGRVRKTIGGRSREFCSRTKFSTPERAHRWYIRARRVFFPESSCAFPERVLYPTFPSHKVEDDIPF